MSKKHGIIIAHVKTHNSIYFHGAMYRKYGFTKVNVRKAWFNHGTRKAHDYHGIVCKKTRYQDNIYKKYGIAMVNVQKHGIIMVHAKAHYYHDILYKKQGITRITSTKKDGIAMVNVQKAWYNHGTCKSTVLPWYHIQKARYYQTGVHKKHSITRITYKKYCISLAPRTKKMLI